MKNTSKLTIALAVLWEIYQLHYCFLVLCYSVLDKVQILLFPQFDMDTTPFNHFVTLNGRFSQFYNDSRDNPSFYNINLKYALTHDLNKTSYLGNIITLGKAFDRSPLFTFRYRQIMAGIGLVYYKTIPIKNNNKLILGLDLIRFYEFINEENQNRPYHFWRLCIQRSTGL